MKNLSLGAAFSALILLAPLTLADVAQPMAADPALEKRVEEVSAELRCLVCQNQTIADSHADLAIDLKNQVRDMLRSGKSNEEVVDYMVERYGDFVRYKPPVKSTTWFLWFGPGILVLVGLTVLMITLRRRAKRVQQAATPISDDEQRKVQQLLQAGQGSAGEGGSR